MRDVYSPFGLRPRPACCMLRSFLLSIELRFSVTKWVDQMRTVPAYAILSGFEFGDTPGVGTFADFFTRLWQYKVFQQEFLNESVDRGLLTPSELALSGNGTASDSESDLPVFPLLQPASRHDSHGFLHCFFTMKTFCQSTRSPNCSLTPLTTL